MIKASDDIATIECYIKDLPGGHNPRLLNISQFYDLFIEILNNYQNQK
jgi:hypothetical protein